MFDYPKQAEFGRAVDKTKIYQYAKPSKRVRDLFVSQVSKIIWKYKLSPETVNLPARDGVDEIQVFEITLKSPDLDQDVLRTIDKAIPSRIFYRLCFENKTKAIAAYKRLNLADPASRVVENYFGTEWQSSGAARAPLPLALDLASLYEQMLRQHIRLPVRPGETLRCLVERDLLIQNKAKLKRDLETRLAKEKQFNRKVEINSQIHQLNAELEKLSSAQEHPSF